MANNNSIFVPQTFNGARMVNVTKRTPASSSASSTSTSIAIASAAETPMTAPALSHPAAGDSTTPPSTSSHSNASSSNNASNNNAPVSEQYKKESKPEVHVVNASPKAKVIPIKPYASSQSVIDTRAKSSHTSRTSTTSSSSSSSAKPPIMASSPLQHQPQQVAPPHMHPQVIIQPSFPGPYDVVGYERVWSEANVAILIQLHRKHYNGVTSLDMDQQNAAWAALTSEYNAITADNRNTPALIKKWNKLMAKYNAERAFLIMPRPQGLQQPVPSVSYWNHFQYMDSYLSHVPLPENCIHKRKRRADDTMEESSSGSSQQTTVHAKRPRSSSSSAAIDLSMELLETQRVFMEKTLDKQNTQIEMMQANAESMHKMNMKFVNICEKACTKSQANEERYLKLLEKCLVLNSSSNKDHTSKKDVAAAIITDVETEQQTHTQKASSPAPPKLPTATSEQVKTDNEK